MEAFHILFRNYFTVALPRDLPPWARGGAFLREYLSYKLAQGFGDCFFFKSEKKKKSERQFSIRKIGRSTVVLIARLAVLMHLPVR